MKKRSVLLSVVLLLLMLATSTCIDSFKPKLKDYQPFLVVEALVTDEEASNYVTISRTIEDPYDKPEKVTEATVEIKDDLGNITTLDEVSKGKYRTDSLTFRGMPGRSYTLYIRTKEGREFESEPCILNEGRDIDSMYFTRGSHPVDGGIVNVPGADLFIDSKGPSDSKYFRWTYEEWWKFRTPNPKTHEYINSRNIIEIPLRNVTCWKKNSSGEIIIQSTDEGTSGEFVKKPVLFVPAEKSDRLLIQYSIHLKQYAISKREYEFWQQMKMISESGGDIFDKQPFKIIGNIHSINGTSDNILGFFQVAGVKKKQLYLTRSEVNQMNLPVYEYDCDYILIGNGNPPPIEIDPPVTFDKMYSLMISLHYIFLYPVYDDFGRLDNLVFVEGLCSDCRLTGTPNKPDFWIDLE